MQKFLLYFLMIVFLLQSVASFAQQTADSIDYNAVTGDIIIKPGADAASIVRSRMFVTVSVNKKSVFVGEPVLVTYKFYTALNSKSQVSRHPQFINCSVVELPYNPDPFLDSFKGKPYAVYIIRRVALTPLQAGNLLLGPAYVDNIAELINENDPFHPKQYSITLNNLPQILPVYALPAKSKPPDFSGLTGKFSITARVTKSSVAAEENDHLIISIKGTGNIEAIGLPVIRWPENTEHFDGTDSQRIQTDSFPISGIKTFDIPFIGKQSGTFEILPIAFNFFNPATQKYSFIQSDTIKVNVTEKQNTTVTFNSNAAVDITNRKYLWIVAAIAIAVGFGIYVTYLKNKQKESAVKTNTALSENITVELPPVINYAIEIERINAISNISIFFFEARNLIFKGLEAKLNMYGSSEDSILAELENKIINPAELHSIKSFLNEYNSAMYSRAEQDISKAKTLLQHIFITIIEK